MQCNDNGTKQSPRTADTLHIPHALDNATIARSYMYEYYTRVVLFSSRNYKWLGHIQFNAQFKHKNDIN